MKRKERKKIEDISFEYTLKSISRPSLIDMGEWIPTEINVDIIGVDPDDEKTFEGIKIGWAKLILIDVWEITENFNLREELEAYSENTSRVGELICGQLENEDTPISSKFCKKLNKAFKTWVDPYDIARIIYVERRTTEEKYRGNNISKLFYEDIFRVFNPEIILSYPFPLQYEGIENLETPLGEFKLNFKNSMKKLKAVYREAGMRSIDRKWMAMMNRRF